MMPSQINGMLEKIDEVRTVFVMGQRSLPFLEELFRFLKEISPVLDEINSSIEETTNKMPRATTQLQSVSEANKLATTEILDLVDAVIARIVEVRTLSEQGARLDAALAGEDDRILQILRDNLHESNAVLFAEVEQLFQRKVAIRKKRTALSEPMYAGLGEIRDRINRIMLSLQVQDITAQQIAAVNHLIESIRGRMHLLVSRINIPVADCGAEAVVEAVPGAFNPDARYDRSPERQSVADAVFGGHADAIPDENMLVVEPARAEIGPPHSPLSDEIPPPHSADDPADTRQPGGDGYRGIQKTYPHLSRNGPGLPASEKASQDEIDRLFHGDA